MKHDTQGVQPDPEKYPTVTFAGVSYEMRLTLFDVVDLWKTHGIDIAQKQDLGGAASIERITQIMSAALKSADGTRLSVEEIQKQIDIGDLPLYTEAVIAVQKKATPAAAEALKRLQATAAQSTPPAAVQ